MIYLLFVLVFLFLLIATLNWKFKHPLLTPFIATIVLFIAAKMLMWLFWPIVIISAGICLFSWLTKKRG